jgi:hypothetical protein
MGQPCLSRAPHICRRAHATPRPPPPLRLPPRQPAPPASVRLPWPKKRDWATVLLEKVADTVEDIALMAKRGAEAPARCGSACLRTSGAARWGPRM